MRRERFQAFSAPLAPPDVVSGVVSSVPAGGPESICLQQPASPGQLAGAVGSAGLGAPPESADAHRRDTARHQDPAENSQTVDGVVTENAALSALVTDDVALAAVVAPPAFV